MNNKSGYQNPFTELHSSVLSHDPGKPVSILSSLISQFTGIDLSQYAALITNFTYKEPTFLSEDHYLLTPTQIMMPKLLHHSHMVNGQDPILAALGMC